jgi:hypothetical protein
MPTIIRVQKLDETHVIVKREDYALTGEVLTTFALLSDGHWRRVGETELYPEECQLLMQKEHT